MKELKLLEHPVRNESKHSLMAYFLLYFPKNTLEIGKCMSTHEIC